MYERILFPTDGSEVAARAEAHAIDLAARYGAELHVLHVASLRELAPVPRLESRDPLDVLRAAGDDIVDAAVDAAADRGVEDVERAVVLGHPVQTILTYSEDNDVDLVVMGTHGRTGLSHYLLGSVAEKVVRHARCPVQVVPGRDRDGRAETP